MSIISILVLLTIGNVLQVQGAGEPSQTTKGIIFDLVSSTRPYAGNPNSSNNRKEQERSFLACDRIGSGKVVRIEMYRRFGILAEWGIGEHKIQEEWPVQKEPLSHSLNITTSDVYLSEIVQYLEIQFDFLKRITQQPMQNWFTVEIIVEATPNEDPNLLDSRSLPQTATTISATTNSPIATTATRHNKENTNTEPNITNKSIIGNTLTNQSSSSAQNVNIGSIANTFVVSRCGEYPIYSLSGCASPCSNNSSLTYALSNLINDRGSNCIALEGNLTRWSTKVERFNDTSSSRLMIYLRMADSYAIQYRSQLRVTIVVTFSNGFFEYFSIAFVCLLCAFFSILGLRYAVLFLTTLMKTGKMKQKTFGRSLIFISCATATIFFARAVIFSLYIAYMILSISTGLILLWMGFRRLSEIILWRVFKRKRQSVRRRPVAANNADLELEHNHQAVLYETESGIFDEEE